MPKEVTVGSPATAANMVCGFDILGFALDGPYDKLTIRLTAERGVSIRNFDSFDLPLIPEKNVIGGALLAMLDELEDGIGFEVDSTKTIKPGSGIGSSAASAAGAVVGANYLLNGRFSKSDLVRFAMNGEKVASGVRHADNLAPAIYGGVTLIRSTFPLDIVSIPAPDLYVTVLHPLIEVKTSNAREILKKEILLKEVHHRIKNNMGTMISLLSLQSGILKEPSAIQALEDAENRLRSMEVLYDKLYRSQDFRELSAADYLPALVQEIVAVFPNCSHVQAETRIDDIALTAELLSPLGIIVNEIITNSMKYAFVGREKGLIRVCAAKKDNLVSLTIEDDGVGIPEGIGIDNSQGFGLILIGNLTDQLKGRMRIERGEGTRFVLEFEV